MPDEMSRSVAASQEKGDAHTTTMLPTEMSWEDDSHANGDPNCHADHDKIGSSFIEHAHPSCLPHLSAALSGGTTAHDCQAKSGSIDDDTCSAADSESGHYGDQQPSPEPGTIESGLRDTLTNVLNTFSQSLRRSEAVDMHPVEQTSSGWNMQEAITNLIRKLRQDKPQLDGVEWERLSATQLRKPINVSGGEEGGVYKTIILPGDLRQHEGEQLYIGFDTDGLGQRHSQHLSNTHSMDSDYDWLETRGFGVPLSWQSSEWRSVRGDVTNGDAEDGGELM